MKIRVVILLIILLVINSCASTNNPANYILVAQGSGSTIEIAQGNALSALSNMIFVNVDSDFTSVDTLNNNKFNQQALNRVNLSSSGYLKGYTFFNQLKDRKNIYNISVGLSKNAIIDNISFLKAQINENSYDTLDKYSLIIQRDKLNFLLALLSYAKANTIYEVDINEYNLLVAKLNELNLKIDSSVRLKFVLYPTNIANINLTLNQKKETPFSDIYLQQGSYSYSIDSLGYVPQKGIIKLSRGDSLDYVIYMQKKLAKKAKFQFLLDNKSSIDNNSLKNFVEKLITTNQAELVKDGFEYKVVILFDGEYQNELSKNFYIQNIPITISIYDGGDNLLIEEKFNSSYVSPTINKDVAYIEIMKVLQAKMNIIFSKLYE